MVNKKIQIIFISIAIIAIDQATKIWARANLINETSIAVVGNWFKLTYVDNYGIAFGLQPGSRIFIMFFTIVVIFGIIYFIYNSTQTNLLFRLAFGFVLGGAIGNLIDRILLGKVTDFIHFDIYNGKIFGKFVSLWPVFNIADSAIVISVIIILIWYNKIFEPAKESDNCDVNETITSDIQHQDHLTP